MTTNLHVLLFLFALLLGSTSALAEVYTWVDEQGKVHFSDTPPNEGARQIAPQATDSSTASESSADPSAEPIPYLGKVPSRRLALTEVRLELPGEGKPKLRVGREYRGYHCNSGAKDLAVDTSRKLPGSSSLAREFHLRLAELAYQPPAFASTGRTKIVTAELTAVASITELELKACTHRKRPDGVRLPSKNLVELAVRWQVHDRLSREQVFEATTRGRFERWTTPYASGEKDKGITTATRYALRSAGEQLLANPEFVALLSPQTALSAQASPAPAAPDPGAIELARASPSSSFQTSLPAVRAATVRIRTVRRSGHGFLLSADYVLTNQRTVAEGKQVVSGPVMVVFETESIPGKLIRWDRTRNAALIKLERAPQASPAPVARSRPSVGDAVYVLGGPLEETPSHTISEGTVTADRLLGGARMRFYQTNARVDRDNPTGPVFNDRGEVVALASGVVDSAGRRPGVYYLIPIEEALLAVDIYP